MSRRAVFDALKQQMLLDVGAPLYRYRVMLVQPFAWRAVDVQARNAGDARRIAATRAGGEWRAVHARRTS